MLSDNLQLTQLKKKKLRIDSRVRFYFRSDYNTNRQESVGRAKKNTNLQNQKRETILPIFFVGWPGKAGHWQCWHQPNVYKSLSYDVTAFPRHDRGSWISSEFSSVASSVFAANLRKIRKPDSTVIRRCSYNTTPSSLYLWVRQDHLYQELILLSRSGVLGRNKYNNSHQVVQI